MLNQRCHNYIIIYRFLNVLGQIENISLLFLIYPYKGSKLHVLWCVLCSTEIKMCSIKFECILNLQTTTLIIILFEVIKCFSYKIFSF